MRPGCAGTRVTRVTRLTLMLAARAGTRMLPGRAGTRVTRVTRLTLMLAARVTRVTWLTRMLAGRAGTRLTRVLPGRARSMRTMGTGLRRSRPAVNLTDRRRLAGSSGRHRALRRRPPL